MVLKLVLFFLLLHLSNGYFKWSNCGVKEKPSAADEISKNSSSIRYAHGCENGAPVTLSCKDGYKIAVLYAFFGHGYHDNKDTCDSSWLGQRCGTHGSARKVRYLCQNKQRCVIDPTSKVLGSTSCVFGLKADLHIRFTCNKEYIPNTFFVNSLNLSPSPLTLPGPVNVSVSLSINRYLAGSTKLKVKIQKKFIGIWTTVPCISNFGSCTYDNFCEMLRGVMFNKCDKEMEARGVPCDCPIPTGTFTVPTQTVNITSQQISEVPVPNFIVNGKYYLKAEFLDVLDKPLGCFELYIQLSISGKKKRSLEIKRLTKA